MTRALEVVVNDIFSGAIPMSETYDALGETIRRLKDAGFELKKSGDGFAVMNRDHAVHLMLIGGSDIDVSGPRRAFLERTEHPDRVHSIIVRGGEKLSFDCATLPVTVWSI